MSSFNLLAIIFAVVVSSFLTANGEVVTVTGWLVDNWCWYDNNKIALDTGGDLSTSPQSHTVHCMVEVSFCKRSGFSIVTKPEGAAKYDILYELDAAGNQKVIDLMLAVPAGSARYEEKGFEVTLTGEVDGNTLKVTEGTGNAPNRASKQSILTFTTVAMVLISVASTLVV